MDEEEIYHYFHCLLIREGVRSLYLMDGGVIKCETFVKTYFPELILKRWEHAICSKFAVSKEPIDEKDLKDVVKLGKLLGYPGADEFAEISRRKRNGLPLDGYWFTLMYSLRKSEYNKSKHGKTKRRYELFGDSCLTEKDDEHRILCDNMLKAVRNSDVLSPYIKNVYVVKERRDGQPLDKRTRV